MRTLKMHLALIAILAVGCGPAEPPSADVDVSESSLTGVTVLSSTDTPIGIPDNNQNGIESDITASLDPGYITGIHFDIDISHPRTTDLTVSLWSPNVPNPLTLYRDSSGPIGPFDLHQYDGRRLHGTWRLQVSDHKGQNIGTLKKWRMRVTTSTLPPPAPQPAPPQSKEAACRAAGGMLCPNGHSCVFVGDRCPAN